MTYLHFFVDFGKVENRKFGGFPPGSPEHAEINVTEVASFQNGSQGARFPEEAESGILKDEWHTMLNM